GRGRLGARASPRPPRGCDGAARHRSVSAKTCPALHARSKRRQKCRRMHCAWPFLRSGASRHALPPQGLEHTLPGTVHAQGTGTVELPRESVMFETMGDGGLLRTEVGT